MSEVVLKDEIVQGTVRCTPLGQIQASETRESGFTELLNEEKQKACQRGREEGEKIGYAKAKEEMEAFLQLLQTITEKMLEEKKRLFDELKPDIIEFALTVAERVIRIELSQPEKLAKLIESFLTHSAFQGETLKVILAPEDLVMLESHLQKISYDNKEIKGLRFASDSFLRRADVRIETKTAILNFALSREMEDIRSKVLRKSS